MWDAVVTNYFITQFVWLIILPKHFPIHVQLNKHQLQTATNLNNSFKKGQLREITPLGWVRMTRCQHLGLKIKLYREPIPSKRTQRQEQSSSTAS